VISVAVVGFSIANKKLLGPSGILLSLSSIIPFLILYIYIYILGFGYIHIYSEIIPYNSWLDPSRVFHLQVSPPSTSVEIFPEFFPRCHPWCYSRRCDLFTFLDSRSILWPLVWCSV
jgi:hypothetical protein